MPDEPRVWVEGDVPLPEDWNRLERTGVAATEASEAAAESAAVALTAARPFLEVTGDHVVTLSDRAVTLYLTGSAPKTITFPTLSSAWPDGVTIDLERAPGDQTVTGVPTLAGLTGGGISHPEGHTSIEVSGRVTARVMPSSANVNGGARFWKLTGETAP
jgi:hypothetical protein